MAWYDPRDWDDELKNLLKKGKDKAKFIGLSGVQYFKDIPDDVQRLADDLFDKGLWKNTSGYLLDNLSNLIELTPTPEVLQFDTSNTPKITQDLTNRISKKACRQILGAIRS